MQERTRSDSRARRPRHNSPYLTSPHLTCLGAQLTLTRAARHGIAICCSAAKAERKEDGKECGCVSDWQVSFSKAEKAGIGGADWPEAPLPLSPYPLKTVLSKHDPE